MYIYILFYIFHIYITYITRIMGKELYINISSIWKSVEKKKKCRTGRPYENCKSMFFLMNVSVKNCFRK